MTKRLFEIILVATLVVVSSSGSMAAEKPLKVYILVGQSNMQGHAQLSTFDYIGMDPKTAPLLKEMRNADGTPRVCENVWISYLTGKDDVMGEAIGKLTVGYGARENPLVAGDKIGPEFTFGIYMQKMLNEPILIIKTAWGGKSLFCDFRPPSAGRYQPIEKPSKAGKKQVKEPEDTEPEGTDPATAEQAKKEGLYYRLMTEHVKKVLADLKRVYPDYDEKQGYELAGFVWFQGWNDMCNKSVYPDYDKPGGYDMYSTLLTHFIRDVRKDLSAPAMPFVIGVMGVDGDKAKEGLANIRPAMAAPAALPEFKGNVVAVQTAPFWDHALGPACWKAFKVTLMMDKAYSLNTEGVMEKRAPGVPGWEIIGKPELQERVWRYTSFTSQQEKDIFTLPETSKPSRWLKRFRDVTLPAGMENWAMPEFDDSKWQQGRAPIGKGVWNPKKSTVRVKNNADWGEGEFLLMRTAFELDAVDLPAYRLVVLSRQGFHVYLNGHKINTYEWWQENPYYRAYSLTENETKYLKKGVNVLAAYANVHCGRNLENPLNSIDLFLEGISKEGQEALNKEYEKICPPEDRAVASGASNQAYHYMGSAKILGQIGKAFAEALVELDKKSGSKKEGNP